MDFFDKSVEYTIKSLNSNLKNGLTYKNLEESVKKYGYNRLTEKKRENIFKKILNCLKEPMLIILLFGFVVTFGAGIGKFIKTGQADFIESFGILGAVVLSVSITIIMEGSSEKAFAILNKTYQNISVKVIRDGQIVVIDKNYLCVGDIVLLEDGDKIVADGRLIESNWLSTDESALTGESLAVKKDANVILSSSTSLAERLNCVYSGTFVASGSGKMVVTSIGMNTEMGKIANEISSKEVSTTPLQQKLSVLGKIITIIGAICAILIFAISMVREIFLGTLSFNSLSELVISCIILIVATVPEGLPTIVAMSLALNMIKLAKENALIKKMSATETAGAISVICSDKTGTLTQNKMSVVKVCTSEYCRMLKGKLSTPLKQNFVCNSTADMVRKNGKISYTGSPTEIALLQDFVKQNSVSQFREERENVTVVYRRPFSSQIKHMATTIKTDDGYRILVKGAPEKILEMCGLTLEQKNKIIMQMNSGRKKAQRILCFAHKDCLNFSEEQIDSNLVYDGYVCLADPIREDVFMAVQECKRAGIGIKMLTGDNMVTAYAIAKELKIAKDESNVIAASHLEKLSDEQLKEILPKISVVARSTPSIKLRIVKALQSMGEIVAVTGDGINDAPAIKNADVGIVMGISGSEITKETADVVLLDDSFATVVKAVAFGRNVYKNLQRFIAFQLSVNLSALLFITACVILGMPSPFNTLQLLWINVIMDGPPALTLGLEKSNSNLMKKPPIKKTENIVSVKMFIRILLNGLFISTIMLMEYLFGFIGASYSERRGVVFSLFVLFQLFNAFNSRELGANSIFSSLSKNKIMIYTFLLVFILHIFIVQVGYRWFDISPMSLFTWIKCLAVASSIIIFSEVAKLMYRIFLKTIAFRNTKKRKVSVLENKS